MLGVTLFGIFFTPVFYVVLRWLTTVMGSAPPPVVLPDVSAKTETLMASHESEAANKTGIQHPPT